MSYIILEDIYENVKEVKKYSLTEADVLILYANHELIKKAILCKMTSIQIAL